MRPAYPGCCQFCPRAERVPGIFLFSNPEVDRSGYVYRLCERHFRPLRRLAQQLAQREAKRRTRGILTAEDFLPRAPDER